MDTARRLTQANASPPIFGCSLWDDTGNEQTFSIDNGSPTSIYSMAS